MIKRIKNATGSTKTWCGQEIASGEYYTIQSNEDATWSNNSTLITAIGNEEAIVNNGTSDLTDVNSGITWLKGTETIRPNDGRLFVQESSRPLGTIITFTSHGDDITDATKVGGGESLSLIHELSDDVVQSKYIDFNFKENRSFIHEGYIIWKNANFDNVRLDVVPKVTTSSEGSNTNFNNYYGIIIPAAGNGTLVVDSADMELVEMPCGLDFGEPKTAFWNADYSTSTHEFSNITAAPSGNGKYNMFSSEKVLGRFNDILLLDSGFLMLQTADAFELGHNMRLKFIITTNGDDHAWKAACIITIHRTKNC